MGQIIDAIGYRADTVNWRIGPSAKAVRKLFHVFFVEFPDTLTAGDRVSVRQLQRVSAYAIRYSATIVPMRPFSMAFSNNFRGASMHKNAKRRLTNATIADLNMWRTILAAVFEKPMWLSVPTAWPIETARCLTEGSSRADIIVYADAQVTDGGLGIYIPNTSWAYAQMCQMTMDDNGRSVPLSNNAAECTADVLAAVAAIECVAKNRPIRGAHIHIRTDNESAVAWINRGRAPGSYQNFLMIFVCMLQIELEVLITASHVPGHENTIADAISRRFQVPNGSTIRQNLSSLKQLDSSPVWTFFCDALKRRSPAPSLSLREARMALANVRTIVSDQSPGPLP